MENKRMFNIIDSDSFLDMPLSAQCLYLHLNERSNESGFVRNPNRIAKIIGVSEDDLHLLIEKKFVLILGRDAIVIRHMSMRNAILQCDLGIDLSQHNPDEDYEDESLNEFYESIWKLYPIKKGKGAVSKAKKQVLQRIGYEEIKRCVDRFIADMEKEGRDKKYWMHGSTFFNSGYVDYLDKNYLSGIQKKENPEPESIEEEEEIPEGEGWLDLAGMTDEEYAEFLRVQTGRCL